MAKSMLGDVLLDVVREESPDYAADVSENAVEDGHEIADHVKQRPLSLSLTVTLTGRDWEQRRRRLAEIMKAKELVRYVGREIHENLVIERISPSYSKDIANGCVLGITLRQVEIARVEIREFYEPDPVTEVAPEPPPPEPDLRQPETVEVDEDTGQSLLAKIVGFFRR
ncbi:MAG: hypothetical protein GXX08_08405 [Firmicutes bacterium]|nr:hypothetical protein [Bacillota bacterium]